MKRVLAAGLAASLVLSATQPVTAVAEPVVSDGMSDSTDWTVSTEGTDNIEPKEPTGRTYADIYSPTFTAEIRGAGPAAQEVEIAPTIDAANAIKAIQIVAADSSQPLGIQSFTRDGKTFINASLSADWTYPERFPAILAVAVQYWDDSAELVPAYLTVYPTKNLVDPAKPVPPKLILRDGKFVVETPAKQTPAPQKPAPAPRASSVDTSQPGTLAAIIVGVLGLFTALVAGIANAARTFPR